MAIRHRNIPDLMMVQRRLSGFRSPAKTPRSIPSDRQFAGSGCPIGPFGRAVVWLCRMTHARSFHACVTSP